MEASATYWHPGTNITVDEAICGYQGRASETVKIKNKPTPEGFKRWALGDSGYLYAWVWHSKGVGPQCSKIPSLNPTASVIGYLTKRLPLGPLNYHLYLDNLFTSDALCTYLYHEGIGCTGTTRGNSGVHRDLLNYKKNPPETIVWGDLETRVNSTGEVLSVAWVDSGPVLFMTNASDPEPQVQKLRKRPAETSSNPRITRPPFRGQATAELSIPCMVNQYNHHMNGVDRGDQLRALGTTPRASKGWKALFYDDIQLALCNAHLLSKRTPGWASEALEDPTKFKMAVAEALISGGGDWGVGEAHPRLDWWFQENQPRPYDFRRGVAHERVKKDRGVYRVCSRIYHATKRDLQAGRIVLGDLPVNALPHVPVTNWGCEACGVNLCFKGKCWEAYHKDLREVSGV